MPDSDLTPFLTSKSPLPTQSAAIAMIYNQDMEFLLQHRDPWPNIHFPSHWCFFGGGIDEGESETVALTREVDEEIGIAVAPSEFTYFTTFDFDFSFAGGPKHIRRTYYELMLPRGRTPEIKLGEGQGYVWCSGVDALKNLRLVPFDYFAICLHRDRDRFVF